jgi:hypothetical protein
LNPPVSFVTFHRGTKVHNIYSYVSQEYNTVFSIKMRVQTNHPFVCFVQTTENNGEHNTPSMTYVRIEGTHTIAAK